MKTKLTLVHASQLPRRKRPTGRFDFGRTAEEMGFDGFELKQDTREYIALYQGDQEGEEYVRHTTFTLQGYKFDEKRKPKLLGRFSATHYLYDYALNSRADIIDEADAVSGEAYGAAVMLYGEEEGILNYDLDLVERDTIKANGLLIESAYLIPEARGHRLGEAVIHRIIERHDPSSLGAVILYPNAKCHIKESDPLFSRENGQEKLVAFYRRMGFEPHPKNERYMYLLGEDWNSEWRNPKPVRRRASPKSVTLWA